MKIRSEFKVLGKESSYQGTCVRAWAAPWRQPFCSALFVWSALALVSCGVKGPPSPPEELPTLGRGSPHFPEAGKKVKKSKISDGLTSETDSEAENTKDKVGEPGAGSY